jgi:hypothetical protein
MATRSPQGGTPDTVHVPTDNRVSSNQTWQMANGLLSRASRRRACRKVPSSAKRAQPGPVVFCQVPATCSSDVARVNVGVEVAVAGGGVDVGGSGVGVAVGGAGVGVAVGGAALGVAVG